MRKEYETQKNNNKHNCDKRKSDANMTITETV